MTNVSICYNEIRQSRRSVWEPWNRPPDSAVIVPGSGRKDIGKMEKRYDVVALGELLIDMTMNGKSEQGNAGAG